MKCPKCRFENIEDSVFCGKCGSSLELEVLCPICSSEPPEDYDFCNKCGHDLRTPKERPPIVYDQPQSYTPKFLADKILTTRSSIEGERKLVTVLFADVANFTSMSEKLDPEEVHQIMDGCFGILMDEVHRYEGTINQFTGDGVMALFGAPIAHEDHSKRACYAALSLQKAMQEYGEKVKKVYGLDFNMRMGLNSGPVIVGSIGDDLRMDYTAVGDTTNLASRMQALARPGAALVSKPAHKLTRDFFKFEFLGKLLVKGKEEPQEAYELVGVGEAGTRIEAAVAKGLTRFVGRKKEMEVLKDAFGMAQSGAGQIVGIVGEAGVGKSRLLLELKGTILEDEKPYHEGRCLHYGGAMPYLPILDILRSYFDIQEGDREHVIKKKMRERLLDLDASLSPVSPSLHEIMSVTVEDEKYPQLDPQQRKERTFEAIRDILIRESQKKPLIVAIEDLHWIDKTSQDFLDYLIGWLPNTRILLILLYRPEYTHTWGSKSYYTQASLDQLSTRVSAELVQAILEEGRVVPELRELILSKAGGNPLFVEELTHSLLENGSIHCRDNQYILNRKISEIEVPDTIQGIIAARLDRVEESLKRIMQVAAVIGREFAYRILETITGMKEELKASLLNLQGLEFIYEKQLFPELEYIFKHVLTQEVAYNSLLLQRRKEIHEKIGAAIEELYAERLEEYYEFLAYHYTRSNNKAKAVEYQTLANWKAVNVNAIEQAKAYFDQVMALLDELPDTEENREQRVLLIASQVIVFEKLLRTQEYYELLTRYEPVAASVKNPVAKGRFYGMLGYCQFNFGYFKEGVQSCNKAGQLCEAGGDPEWAAGLYMTEAWAHCFLGRYEDVISLEKKVCRTAREEDAPIAYMRIFCIASVSLLSMGRWDEAETMGQRTLAIGKKYANDSFTSWGAWAIGFAYLSKRDLEQASKYAKMAVQIAPTPMDEAIAQFFLASVQCHTGELEAGIMTLSALVSMFKLGRLVASELMATWFLGEGYLLAGEYGKAEETLEGLLTLSERCSAKGMEGVAHRLLGEVALETEPSSAAGHFEKGIIIAKEVKAENELALAYAGLGRLHKQQGRKAEARKYLAQALEIFERLGTLIEPDKVREELSELSGRPMPGPGKRLNS